MWILLFFFCLFPWHCIRAGIPETLKQQLSTSSRTPLSSSRIISTQTGNFHDVLLNLTNIEKGYQYYKTFTFTVSAGVYEINLILACSDEYEIDLSTSHPDFQFRLLYPDIEVPESQMNVFLNAGKVYGVHDVGVSVFRIEGVAATNQSYTISLEYTPEHNGYTLPFYSANEHLGRPVRWLVEPGMNKDETITMQANTNLDTDYILITTQPRQLSCDFWSSANIQGNWNFGLYDITKRGVNQVTPVDHSSDPGYLGSTHRVNAGIYKYHLSATRPSNSAWNVRAYTDAYARTATAGYYVSKIPYFNRTAYNPEDYDEDGGSGLPLEFVYDDFGNRRQRTPVGPVSRAIASGPDITGKARPVPTHTISIFPNPTDGRFTVEIFGMDRSSSGDITVVDFFGKVIVKREITSGRMMLDISKEQSGFYFMQVRIDGELTPWRIVKK